MKTYVFSYRDEDGNLVDVRTVASNNKKALKAFFLKAPGVEVDQIESINGNAVNMEKRAAVSSSDDFTLDATGAVLGSVDGSDEKSRNIGMGVFGLVSLAVGMYLLIVSPGADSGAGGIVNFHKLIIGQTFSVIGAIFVGIQWRPR
ncbi:MAG: hypothetical protein JXJ30_09400 [Halothiobacillaceae bacterium]|nr:hypothetical protein [Halothiobacillaceae bacterium]